MVEPHVKRCLGTIDKIRIAKGLLSETVPGAIVRLVVRKQADIQAVIRFVAGRGQYS